MTDYSGFIFTIDEPQRAKEIQALVNREQGFSDVLSIQDWQLNKREVFLLSLEPDVLTHAALVVRGSQVATSKNQIKFLILVPFSPHIYFKELVENYHLDLNAYLTRSSTGAGRRTDVKNWLKLLNAIKEVQPATSEKIDQLLALLTTSPRNTEQEGFLSMVEEKDALNLAMRMAGFDYTILEAVPLHAQPTPFVEIVKSLPLREDKMIEHDAHVEAFGDLKNFGSRQSGWIIFKKGTERLLVMNVNRQPIEKTLGVDLLYYQERYHSYVMVQYKRLLKEAGDWVFRISNDVKKKKTSYADELDRMRHWRHYLATRNEGVGEIETFRLHNGLFYFKLCRAVVKDPDSTDMIEGTYLPLDYWEELLKSEKVIGPQGESVLPKVASGETTATLCLLTWSGMGG